MLFRSVLPQPILPSANGPDETTESLDLSLFPVLKELHSTDLQPLFSSMLTRLPPTNVINLVRVALLDLDVGVHDLRQFEAAILSGKLPALRRVEVGVMSSAGAGFFTDAERASEESMAQTLKTQLSVLHRKGLLFLKFLW